MNSKRFTVNKNSCHSALVAESQTAGVLCWQATFSKSYCHSALVAESNFKEVPVFRHSSQTGTIIPDAHENSSHEQSEQ